MLLLAVILQPAEEPRPQHGKPTGCGKRKGRGAREERQRGGEQKGRPKPSSSAGHTCDPPCTHTRRAAERSARHSPHVHRVPGAEHAARTVMCVFRAHGSPGGTHVRYVCAVCLPVSKHVL